MREYLIISTTVDLFRVASDDIMFISSDGNYSVVFSSYGDSRIVTLQLGHVEELIMRQLVNTNSPMFLSDTESLAPSQIEMLRAIKDGVQQLSSMETKSSYALGNPNTISKNKKVLKDKDIIEERKGKLVFVDPVYRFWYSQDY